MILACWRIFSLYSIKGGNMTAILNATRKRILCACCVVSLLLAVTFALTVRTHSQQLQVLNQEAKNEMLEQIEKSADQPLRIVGNDDCALKIVEARVK